MNLSAEVGDNSTVLLNGTILSKDRSYVNEVIATAEKMHYITSGFCIPTLMFFGIIGNILSINIWQKKSLRSSTGMYLTAQAINDMGVLVSVFLSDSLVILFPQIKTKYQYGVFHSYIGYPVSYFFVVNSIWTLVGVTVDRYIQVCWIIQAKVMCSHKAAKTGIALITAMCFIINTPHFNTYYPINTSDRKAGEPAYSHTEFGAGTGSQMYEFWVHCMFLVLAPWLTIFILNMAILHRVASLNKQMTDKRGERAQIKAQRKENQLTKLLLTVTFTFLLLIALQCITQCFFMLQPEFSDTKIVNESYAIAKLGVVINSSINVVLYCISGERFRQELRLLLLSKLGCIRADHIADVSDMYSVDPRKKFSCPSDTSSQTECRGSLPSLFKRIDTPIE